MPPFLSSVALTILTTKCVNSFSSTLFHTFYTQKLFKIPQLKITQLKNLQFKQWYKETIQFTKLHWLRTVDMKMVQ